MEPGAQALVMTGARSSATHGWLKEQPAEYPYARIEYNQGSLGRSVT